MPKYKIDTTSIKDLPDYEGATVAEDKKQAARNFWMRKAFKDSRAKVRVEKLFEYVEKVKGLKR